VAAALHAGLDLDCGDFLGKNAQQALDNGTIVESDIDRALERTFNVLVRLGWFDPPEQQPYRQLGHDYINSTESQQVALESAQESIVLLKNVNKALPLNIDQLQGKTIALIGPNTNATQEMQGGYHGRAPFLIDPFTAFKSLTADKSINVNFSFGCHVLGLDQSGFPAAIELARQADVVIFFGGHNQTVEREGHDRVTIDLPPIQLALLQELEKVVRSPIHVVIMSGSGIDLSYIRDSPNYGSLTWMGFPGQAGGMAVATVIFGQYNPGGRLPITFYPALYVNETSMTDMRMRPSPTNPGRTYKFYTGQAVYEFGAGLSYTTFAYSWSNDTAISSYSINTLIKDNHQKRSVTIANFRVNVTNTGSMAGDDVVLAFITPPQLSVSGETPPIKQLFGFERVHLNVSETVEVFFPMNIDALLSVAHDGSKWLHPGLYRIMIGKQWMHTIELRSESALWSLAYS
jgi:hypothetical protein